jgi:hypothetical protein
MEGTEKTAEKRTEARTAKEKKFYSSLKTSHDRITMSKISTPDKPETPKVPEVCKKAKIMSEISTSDKPETPKIPEVCKMISEIPTFDKPETSKVPEVCKRSKIMSEIPTSDEPKTPKVPEACKILKIMPEITLFDTVTSDKPETPKASEVCKMSETTSEISTSERPETPKVPKVCEMSKTMSEISISDKPETPKVPKVCKMPKTMSEISIFVKPETAKIPEVCEILKTISEISISDKPETPKLPEVCEIPKTISEISTFDKPETAKIPEVCEIPKTMSEISISNEPETPKVPEVCQPPKITLSKTFTSDKPEIPKVSEECEKSESTSEISTCIKSEDNAESPKDIKNDNPKIVISIKSENDWLLPNLESEANAESPKDIKNDNPEISTKEPEESSINDSKSADNADNAEKIICEKTLLPNLESEDNTESPKDINNENPEISTKEPEESSINDSKSADIAHNAEKIICEKTLLPNLESEDNAESPKDINNENPQISTKEPEESSINDSKSADNADNAEKLLPNLESKDNAESPKDINNENTEISTKEPEESSINDSKSADNADNAEKIICEKTLLPNLESEDNAESPKDIKNENPEISIKKPEESSTNDTKSVDSADNTEKIIRDKTELLWNVAAMRKVWPPLSNPNFETDCLVLATVHMLPSFPMKIFELFAEMIEAVTNQPVVLMHECRHNRPKTAIMNMADIIIAPAAETEIADFELLPVSFVFDHHQNKTKSASVYADVIVASDRAPHINKILDLRGHCCAIIDEKCNHLTADGLLFFYLQSKGENQAFFGNRLVANTQLEVLEMVASRQAQVGILESPVSRCNIHNVPGASTLQVLSSIGPLPPYRIMIDGTRAELSKKIERFLLNVDKDELWMERLMPFGILGFAPNSSDRYKPAGTKVINPGVPYY